METKLADRIESVTYLSKYLYDLSCSTNFILNAFTSSWYVFANILKKLDKPFNSSTDF